MLKTLRLCAISVKQKCIFINYFVLNKKIYKRKRVKRMNFSLLNMDVRNIV